MEIQDLLAKKNFEALTPQESVLVLQEMTQKEYERQRQVILMSQAALEKEAANLYVPAPSATLLMALKQKQVASVQPIEKEEKKKGRIVALLSYQIPAWQAVAAALILIFMGQFWNNSKANTMLLAAGEHLVDTVLVEKIVTEVKEVPQPSDTVYKVVYKTKYVSDASPEKPRLMATTSTHLMKNEAKEREAQATFANVMSYYNKSKNRPASQDTFLQIVSQNVQF